MYTYRICITHLRNNDDPCCQIISRGKNLKRSTFTHIGVLMTMLVKHYYIVSIISNITNINHGLSRRRKWWCDNVMCCREYYATKCDSLKMVFWCRNKLAMTITNRYDKIWCGKQYPTVHFGKWPGMSSLNLWYFELKWKAIKYWINSTNC